ncbi:hypothetical protein LTR22_024103 [Elasticomyces elasticus]|nr:hypothetical protein LTR22_024103 [Elasticomyces elasticus]KAK4906228.1 hypothetical protein LTR49_024591 [Elasticomyces elasticus]KAK5744698.1 hypothetical protein LTS12_023377 [Elasticomyces elasticus]
MSQRKMILSDGSYRGDYCSTQIGGIGDLYADQCKLAQAEEIYTRALEGYEKELGADHTSTLDTVNNLGSVYLRQGKRAEAEEMYMRALEGLAATL